MRHIFVSYCHEDAAFAQTLEEKIREARFNTWRDLDLNAGDNWRTEIDEGIKDALAVIVVMSPHSSNSAYVTYEWSFALGCGIPVLPLLLNLSADQVHPRLSVLQSLDFANDLARSWNRLSESLNALADAEREFTLRVPRDAPPVVREAASALDDMDRGRRRAAIESLADMNHPAAVELLAEAVRHPIQEVRFGAAFQLGGKFHDPRALPVLIEALRSGDESLELWMISRIGEPAVPIVLQTLQEKDFPRRDDLFTILGYIGGAAVVQALIECLGGSNLEDRIEAALALSQTESIAALPQLRAAMHDGSTKLRSAVATALGKCGGPAAVPDLIEMLRDADREVRHSAVCGLGEICNVKPMPAALEPNVAPMIAALIEGMDDEYEQVRAFARRALRDLQDPAAIPSLVTALAGKRKFPGGITEVLKAFEDAAVLALRAAIHDPNARVRLAAIETIARYGEETDAPLVAEAIRDADPDVRLRAIKAVGSRMGESTLIQEALVERLHDTEEDVCLAAIRALGDIRSASTAPQLIECMKVEALAPYAAGALQWIDTREARAALKAWNKTKK